MKTEFFKNVAMVLMLSALVTIFMVAVPPPDVMGKDPVKTEKASTNEVGAVAEMPAQVVDSTEGTVVEPALPTDEEVDEAVDELIEKMVNKYTLISSAIINALVYLLGLIPFAFFKDDRKRDLLVKTLVAVGVAAVYALTLGPGNIWPVLSGFALAVFNYNNVLKPVVGSTKSAAAKKS